MKNNFLKLFLLALTLLSFSQSKATTLTVISNGDNSITGEFRRAVTDASPGDTIDFALLAQDTIEINPTFSTIVIDKDLTILGPGANSLVLDGQGFSRILSINAGVNVRIEGIKFYNGQISFAGGAAIFNQGNLTVNACGFDGNISGMNGGAINNASRLVVQQSDFMGNDANTGAGIFSGNGGRTFINDCIFNGNSSTGTDGAVRSDQITLDTLEIINSLFDSNMTAANGRGGAVSVSGFGYTLIRLTNFSNNSALDGGALFLNSITSTIDSCQFNSNNAVNGSGGAIAINASAPTVEYCTFDFNDASSFGGGIYITNGAALTMNFSRLSDNSASLGGGAIYSNSLSTSTITTSLIDNNSCVSSGGGIFLDDHDLILENTTLSGNSSNSGLGGGIYLLGNQCTATLTHNTITRNTASSGAGPGIGMDGGSTLNLTNNIVAGNFPTGGDIGVDVSTIATNLNNIIGDTTGSGHTWNATNFVGGTINPVNPGIEPLANNTGFAFTHALQCSSIAVDAASPTSITIDQRGMMRVPPSDIGAYELIVAASPTAIISGTAELCPNLVGTDSLTVLLTGTAPFNLTVTVNGTDLNWIGLTEPVFKFLPTVAGTHTVTRIEDASFCNVGTGSGAGIVTASTLAVTLGAIVNTTCGDANSSITATATGGSGNYSYIWNNSDIHALIDSIPAGIYVVEVTDTDNGCFVEATATLSNTDGPTLSIGSVTDVSCAGLSDGSIDLDVNGGTAPFEFAWTNGGTTEDISGLNGVPHEVIVTDANGCVATLSVPVGRPDPITATFNVTASTCGGSDGVAVAVPAGGTGTYAYVWDAGSTTDTQTGLALGAHSVTITDVNGCVGEATAAVGEIGGPMLATDSIQVPFCNTNNGGIYITPLSGTAPFVYNWNNGLSSDQDLVNIGEGIYFATVTDASGCASSIFTQLNPAPPAAPPICLVTVDSLTQRNLVTWEKVPGSGIVEYRVYRETTVQTLYTNIATVSADSLSEYLDTVANTSLQWWKYKIKAVDSCGNQSLISDAVFHKTIKLNATRVVNNEIELVWSDYFGFEFSEYEISRFTTSLGLVSLGTVPKTTQSFNTPIPADTAGIYYLVEAIIDEGCIVSRAAGNINSSRSNTGGIANLMLDTVNSISELSVLENLEVYPNPSQGNINLAITPKQAFTANLSILSMQGKLVHNSSLKVSNQRQNFQLNLSDLAKGVYILRLANGDEQTHRKLIIE